MNILYILLLYHKFPKISSPCISQLLRDDCSFYYSHAKIAYNFYKSITRKINIQISLFV